MKRIMLATYDARSSLKRHASSSSSGPVAALNWVRRTLAIYRSAVLNRRHFARTGDYRRKSIASCLSFRRWLASIGVAQAGKTAPALRTDEACPSIATSRP